MTLLSIHPPAMHDQRKIVERTQGIRGLHVVLLKPSKYDDDGYILRHWRGVLPSNTLACLYALTEDVKRRRALREDLEVTVELLDEAVHKLNVPKIIRRSRRPGLEERCQPEREAENAPHDLGGGERDPRPPSARTPHAYPVDDRCRRRGREELGHDHLGDMRREGRVDDGDRQAHCEVAGEEMPANSWDTRDVEHHAV